MFLSNLRVALVLLLLGTSYGADVRASVALGGAVLGLAAVAASGFVPTTVRSATLALKRAEGNAPLRETVAREVQAALGAALVLVVVGCATVGVAAAAGATMRLFALYAAAAMLGLVLAPLRFVISGAFQALHKDGRNLAATIIGSVVQVAIAGIVSALPLSDAAAVGVLGGSVSLISLGSCITRTMLLYRLGALELGSIPSGLAQVLTHPHSAYRGLIERAAASVDGIVFVTFFTATMFIATAYDAHSGAVVGLTVTVMRSIIVPLKQFGLVGGRFVLASQGKPNSITLGTIQRSCGALLLVGAAILLGLRGLTPILDQIPWVVLILMVVQLILEPWAGMLYAYTKVVHSAYTGLPALFISYAAIGLPALAVVMIAGAATPLAIWLVLLATRVLFVGLQLYTVRSIS